MRDDDDDATPVESPDAKRKKSSRSMPAVKKCPACEPNPKGPCAYCHNDTVGGPTRYVSEERRRAYFKENGLFDPDEIPDTEPGAE